MPMLAFNPHEAVCPNFTSEKYLQARECLLNDGINHEAAANQLELLWTVNNDLERQEWDRQTLAEQEADEERETSHRRLAGHLSPSYSHSPLKAQLSRILVSHLFFAMPKLTHNPHFAEQPNFSSEKYHQAREHLVNDDVNHEAAAAQLALYWTLNNDLEKEEWDCQAHQEQQEAAERARLDEEEQERQQAERKRERELALQEEKKKYCHKYAMVPQDAVVPADPIIIPSQITAC
ncbi:hypothetical protein BKA82DRAFT_4364323 [Pisolithus tinctorius]|nr:hypothetical protein BKA82DRAFT_4364323 [Pisolithus tinctorius]